MDLRGFNKFTLVDYPGRIGCIVFTGGCNLRCPFCHNPCLVFDPTSQPRVTEKEFFGFLDQRRGLIEGVVISGGEPMLHEDIGEFIRNIRSRDYLVKVDSNGTFPDRVERLLQSVGVDAMGIDYKAPAARYAQLTGTGDETVAERVRKSIRLALGAELVRRWVLQQYNPVEVIDDELSKQPTYSDRELVQIARHLGPEVKVRGLHGRIVE